MNKKQPLFQYSTRLLTAIIVLLSATSSIAQQTYPVTVNSFVQPPYSPYFQDYFSPSSNKWNSTIVFNDFTEPSWEVKLKITIESNNVKIQTRPTFIPPVSIKVFPGVPYTVTAADLAPYFEYNNLILNGITSGQLSQNGRLPEGFYSFCIEVLDYHTGSPLSLKSCSNFWIQLNDEPLVITPMCGNVIRPNPAQNIVFQWQPTGAVSPNSMGTEYQLTLYEITDPNVNPLNAIKNNKVLKIFESGFVQQTTFIYDMTAPVLDIGKKYAYTIQARDIEGKDIFKNKGLSQPCWFWYGYPNGGSIDIVKPTDKGSFTNTDPLSFQWGGPSLTLPGQIVAYKIKIVKVDSSQTAESAMTDNPAWYEEVTASTNKINGYDILLKKKPEPQTLYAWQVTAITEDQEIATSPVYTFYGPGLIDEFLAGNHRVQVKTTFNLDLNHLNGIGQVQLDADGKTQEVQFSNLRIISAAGRYVLDYGTISAALEDTSLIELNPDKKENREAYFHPKKFSLDKNSLQIYGYVTWETHLVQTSLEKVVIRTENEWMNFDSYSLRGSIHLNSSNRFALLDPYHFNLDLSTDSDFLIDRNKFSLRFKGELLLPEIISGTDYKQSRVNIPFTADQLFYLQQSNVQLKSNILPLQNSNLVMAPSSWIIDLSEAESPLKLKDHPEWKGIYFPQFNIRFNRDTDKFGDLKFTEDYTSTYQLLSSNGYKNWIGADGLNLSFTHDFSEEKSTYNTFPATLDKLQLEIERNSVKNSSLTGSILIPFVSTEQPFAFTAPLSNTGFQPGYLENLDGTKFTFNKGSGEQEILLTITRAVFAGGERLDMTLDIEWPGLAVNLTALTGFRAYGNYDIGFLMPKGAMALSQQLNGTLRNTYPVVFDGIGAGSSNGAYAFGLTGKAVLAEDVSGHEGPPAVNMYSTVPNAMLPKTPYVPAADNVLTEAVTAGAKENSFDENVKIIKNDLVNRLRQSSATVTDRSESIDLKGSLTEGSSEKAYDPSEMVDRGKDQEPQTKTWASVKFTINQEKLVEEAMAAITIAMTQAVTDKIKGAVDKQVGKLTDKIDKTVDTLNIKIDREIHKLVDTLAARVGRKLKTEKFDPTEQINTIADSIALKLSKEVKGNISYSIDKNIKNPFKTFIDTTITGRANGYVEAQVRGAMVDLVEGKFNAKDIINRLIDDLPILIGGMGNDAFALINAKKLRRTIYHTGEDAIGNIKVSDIDNMLIRAISAEASYIVSKQLSKMASEEVNKLANKILSNDGNVSASAGLGVKMNFENLGRNLKEGKVDKIVKLDAVSVALNTKFVAFGGLLYFSADDPVYGNIWKGAVKLDVKMPKKFSLAGIYINGRKDDVPYWFCQISGAKGDSAKPGGVMDKTAKPLSSPVNLGPVELMGASGRLYHHMTDQPGYPIMPDPATDYGAYISFVFFDKAGKGNALRLAVGAGVEIREDGNYVIDFNGDAQFINKNPQVLTIDPMAKGAGGIHINYNSAESHFLGEGWVQVQSGVCLKGNFLVDTKPGYWLVQIGKREDPLMITPGCAGWGAVGWVGVDPTTANIGLGLSYSLNTTVNLDLKLISAGLYINAGLAAGIQATAQYKPSFKLMEAGIWAEAWAQIIAYYKTKVKSGSVQLVDIYLSGDLLMKFNPPPTMLSGNLKGHVEVLCFGIDFETGFEKTLKN